MYVVFIYGIFNGCMASLSIAGPYIMMPFGVDKSYYSSITGVVFGLAGLFSMLFITNYVFSNKKYK